MRRDFSLPEDDVEFLESTKLAWETIREGETLWLLLHEFPIPAGYNVTTSTAAIQIPASYPLAALDMVFFLPHLALTSGKSIPNIEARQEIGGQSYQRWSRHYTPQHPWRVGEYGMETHVSAIRNWLEIELTR
jgi:Prokaryotic E2 family E